MLTGLDMSSVNSSSLSKYVAQIRDSGSDDIIGLPGLLSPFSPNHEAIIVALVPVYLNGANPSVAHAPVLRGFITTFFSIEELVRGAALADQPKGIGFQLIDATGDGGLKNLYHYGEPLQRRMAYQRPLVEVFGRRWSIVASPSDEYIVARRSIVPAVSFFGGFVFTGLLVLYTNLTQRQTQVVRALVDERTRELQHANEKLEQLSRIDSLTEVANRRHFNEVLQLEWKRSIREQTSLAILLIDVDFFKRFNDHHGHLYGDECLLMVARTLRSVFKRPGDLVSRYGGEEFAVILPNSDEEVAEAAERYRQAVEQLGIAHPQSEVAAHVTVSIGVSSVVPNESILADDLLDAADKGLYAAKAQGRNRVVYQACDTGNIVSVRAGRKGNAPESYSSSYKAL